MKFKLFQRCANIVVINALHRTTTDTSIEHHKIPKDTTVIGQVSFFQIGFRIQVLSYRITKIQIHSIHEKDAIFKNSEDFNPDRFLMDDLQTPNKAGLVFG